MGRLLIYGYIRVRTQLWMETDQRYYFNQFDNTLGLRIIHTDERRQGFIPKASLGRKNGPLQGGVISSSSARLLTFRFSD